jgi:hypothetical protein
MGVEGGEGCSGDLQPASAGSGTGCGAAEAKTRLQACLASFVHSFLMARRYLTGACL